MVWKGQPGLQPMPLPSICVHDEYKCGVARPTWFVAHYIAWQVYC